MNKTTKYPVGIAKNRFDDKGRLGVALVRMHRQKVEAYRADGYDLPPPNVTGDHVGYTIGYESFAQSYGDEPMSDEMVKEAAAAIEQPAWFVKDAIAFATASIRREQAGVEAEPTKTQKGRRGHKEWKPFENPLHITNAMFALVQMLIDLDVDHRPKDGRSYRQAQALPHVLYFRLDWTGKPDEFDLSPGNITTLKKLLMVESDDELRHVIDIAKNNGLVEWATKPVARRSDAGEWKTVNHGKLRVLRFGNPTIRRHEWE